MTFEVTTLKRRPELKHQVGRLAEESWPNFLLYGSSIAHWERLFDDFAEYQILFCDLADDLIAVGHTAPFMWQSAPEDLPSTMDGIMERAVRARRDQSDPNTLSALAALVAKSHRGRGLGADILWAMRSLAAEHGMHSLVAPVRPTSKSSYPLTSFERYVGWRRNDGSPFDPWLRVHWRLGAQFLKVIPESLVVVGQVPEWEDWTGMSFPESGKYVVPGALQPTAIDREQNLGTYLDPNIWTHHLVREEGFAE